MAKVHNSDCTMKPKTPNNMKTDGRVGNVAYIDVGGGSTEVSLIHDGALAESVSTTWARSAC